jgi:hypothetical protein
MQDRSLRSRWTFLDSLSFPVEMSEQPRGGVHNLQDERLFGRSSQDFQKRYKVVTYVFPLLFAQTPQQGDISRERRNDLIVVDDLNLGVLTVILQSVEGIPERLQKIDKLAGCPEHVSTIHYETNFVEASHDYEFEL